MQTATRAGELQQRAKQAPPQPRRPGSWLGGLILFGVLLAGWTMFVMMLEDFDFDTGFIALFCATLSMFVIKAFGSAVRGRDAF